MGNLAFNKVEYCGELKVNMKIVRTCMAIILSSPTPQEAITLLLAIILSSPTPQEAVTLLLDIILSALTPQDTITLLYVNYCAK